MTAFTVATFAERPDLSRAADNAQTSAWPEFMLHDLVANRLWDRLRRDFPDFQFMLLGEGDELFAVGYSIPLVWNGDFANLPDAGWDWGIQRGVEGLERGETPNTLCAMAISVLPAYQGSGLSRECVKAMRGIAAKHGFGHLIAPVRPNKKHLYPLIPIDRYIGWTNADGAPFDAWLRVHWRLGAKIVKACPQSMLIEDTVEAWEMWTGMQFPDSGQHIVPGALVPVEFDLERNVGRYVEPNVWMAHTVSE